MEIIWTFPKLKNGFNPPAVYRIDFDNGFFYIGGSKHIKTRMSSWRTVIKSDRFYSKMLGESIKGAKSAVFRILEITTLGKLRDVETYYIRESFADTLCLNQSSSGHLTQGLKPIPEHLKRPKKIKPSAPKKEKKVKVLPADHVWAYSKGVIQFDVFGNYIMSHINITKAAQHVGVHDSVIREHVKTKVVRGVLGKYVFRIVGDNEPWHHSVKIVNPKPLLDLPGKLVIDLNTGVFYYSAREASIASGIKEKQFYKMLSGEVPNNTFYMYA